MKKFWKVLGWVCLGIFLQFKFNVLYGIVFLENLNFHDRTYIIKMSIAPSESSVGVLQIETVVHHSLGANYFANVYIPDKYKVLNMSPYKGAEAISGYEVYKMDMQRKYRDVLDHKDLLITPKNPDENIPSTPVLVHFENMNQLLHSDKTYRLVTSNQVTHIEGPPAVETVYPQKWGM